MESKTLRTRGDRRTNENRAAVTNERLLRRGLPMKESCLIMLSVDCVRCRWLCLATWCVSVSTLLPCYFFLRSRCAVFPSFLSFSFSLSLSLSFRFFSSLNTSVDNVVLFDFFSVPYFSSASVSGLSLYWVRLSFDHGWIAGGSVEVRQSNQKSNHRLDPVIHGYGPDGLCTLNAYQNF